MSTRLLRDVAHARAGDKGDRSSVCVFVYDPAHYDAVAAQLTPERLKQQFAGLFRGPIIRYDLPGLDGFRGANNGGPDGVTFVDSIVFGAQTQDESFGRFPDGSTTWTFMSGTSPVFVTR